ncbi:endonuclease/exonuclease/phosphatase family protein [Spongisporangium articulatum]|uniref:Endonuclease/exonuclease/phosphatase family protein n=1 Tax=Spongisporangium articulatum TaxID=3362603 RepID=A0ABW8AK64_9ACTN
MLVNWLLVLLALPAGALTAARLLEGTLRRSHTPVPQLAAFAPWALLPWAATAVLAAATSRWLPALVAWAGFAVHAAWFVPARAPQGPGGLPVRLASVNVLFGRADPAALVKLAADVDVLVVQELTPQLSAALRGGLEEAGFTETDLHPAPYGMGTGVWSRWPLRPAGLLRSGRNRMPQVVVDAPGGSFELTAVHTTAPQPGHLQAWRHDLDSVRAAVRTASGPAVFAGDFNASRDHPHFRRILAAGTADALDVVPGGPLGLAPAFTWPADKPWPALTRLDHVLVTPQVRVDDARVTGVPGTDHRAVVVRLALTT